MSNPHLQAQNHADLVHWEDPLEGTTHTDIRKIRIQYPGAGRPNYNPKDFGRSLIAERHSRLTHLFPVVSTYGQLHEYLHRKLHLSEGEIGNAGLVEGLTITNPSDDMLSAIEDICSFPLAGGDFISAFSGRGLGLELYEAGSILHYEMNHEQTKAYTRSGPDFQFLAVYIPRLREAKNSSRSTPSKLIMAMRQNLC